ncbi:MAG: twin-arginine translocase TatA/TatE family subunit [Flavobacteriales bacterium]
MSIFMAIGPYQIGVIVLVIVLLFGGRKIPELMKGLGGGVKEFKKAIKDDDDDDKTESGEE